MPRQVQGVEPIKLAPVKNPNKKGNGNVFIEEINVELMQEEHIFFNSEGIYAEGTAMVSGDNRKIISDDRIAGEIQSLECPSDKQLIVELRSQAGYDTAKADWSWVQGGGNTFVFIVTGDCGGDDGIRAYEINEASFDDSNQKATLKGEVKDPEQWMDDANIHISTQPFDGFHDAAEKREKEGDVSFASDFSGKEIFGMDVSGSNKTRLGLTCADCGITGGVHYDLDVSKKTGISGSITAKNGLGVRFALGLQLSAQLSEQKDVKVDILPPTGIPGASIDFFLGSIGFQAAAAVVASLGSVDADIVAKFGTAMTIPDGTAFRFGSDSDKFDPHFEQIGPELSASVSVSASLNPVVTLGVGGTLKVLKWSKTASAGVALEAPMLSATLDGRFTTAGGACNNPDSLVSIGLEVKLNGPISVFYGFGDPTDLPNRKQIYDLVDKDLINVCFPIGGSQPQQPQNSTVVAPKLRAA
ncbi:hypothetical protein EJ04DRAFT_570903 [Polyplosphaeria fusca]|uniref:Uncharacterized protein n=1 Tax=Polyplosphaeria fusca TaxID=682080 RepID=A0A9P4QL04_9PLEO|nr:hypothetical protein EJ04DRAFT_570903 [Polyplosphaeria fusca]